MEEEHKIIKVNSPANKPLKKYLFKHKYTLERCIVISHNQRTAFNAAMNYLRKQYEDNEITLLNTTFYK